MLSKEQKEIAKDKLKEFMSENFDIDIGNLQAEMFVEHFEKYVGAFYYNKAVADSMGFITERIDDLYLLMKDETEGGVR